jgi:hypothetical protein
VTCKEGKSMLRSLPQIGAWRSLVARLLWEQEVGGSNPLAPTNNFKHLERVLMEPVLFFPVDRRCDRRFPLI